MMKLPYQISAEVYSGLLDRLNGLGLTDRLGYQNDLGFFHDDQWLTDTAVIERLVFRQGEWDVVLLFAHCQMPLKFLTRRITSHPTPARAAQMAFYMGRLAAKDQRGTLRIEPDRFITPEN